MRPNCSYESCISRAGKNGFCLKHKNIGEAVEALLLLSKNDEKHFCRHSYNRRNTRKGIPGTKVSQGRVEKSSGKNKVSRKKV